MAQLHFDATTVEPDKGRDYSLIPAGTALRVEITDSEVKTAKSGGTYLSIEYTVIDPEAFRNRKVWQQITLTNDSEKAVEIGRAQLSALCHATGLLKLTDTDQFFQRILVVKIGIRKGTVGYSDQNVVTAVDRADGDMASTPAPARQAAPAKAPTAPPWARK